MTPGFDPTQVDWNNPGVEYLMKNFERTGADHRDEIMSLTKSNNQLTSEKEHLASKNKELEERCSHLEAKYDKLIEMYNGLLDGAGNGITPDNPPVDPDAGSKTTPKRHPEGGRRSSYNVREFVGYPRPKPPARSEAGRPAREHVVHETMTADELACRKCDCTLSAPTAKYEKTTEDLVDHRWQETVWKIIRRYCKKCRKDIEEPFEIEHIWANKFEEHDDEFTQNLEFDDFRNMVGALMLIPGKFNKSYGALPYEKKLPHYYGHNMLAQTLSHQCYENNPSFINYIKESKLPFRPHEHFKKSDLLERQKLYQKICEEIWDIRGFDEIVNR